MLGDKALRNNRLEFVKKNVNGVNLVASVARDHALAESGREVVVHFAQHSNVFAYDLYAIGALRSGCSVRVDGRDVRLSIGRGLRWSKRVAPAHEVAAFASDAFDINTDVPFCLRLDEF